MYKGVRDHLLKTFGSKEEISNKKVAKGEVSSKRGSF